MNVTLAGRRPPQTAATMRAAVLVGPCRTELVEVPVPRPGPGQVRVRLQGCGVCASNVVPWEGPEWMDFPTAPGALGHEAWGVVDAVGEEVTSLAPGDRVATLFQDAYAPFVVGDASAAVRLPPGLADQPFPGEPLACAVNVFRRSAVLPDQFVAVIGVGFLGAILVRLASLSGARVIAIGRRASALEKAASLGAWRTLPLTERPELAGRVEALTGGALCARVIEATGKEAPLQLAGDLAAERGRIVIAGYHQDGPRRIDMQQWNWKGLDVVNAHERQPAVYLEGMRQAIALVERGVIPLSRLLTHAYPLEKLDEALAATRDRPEGFMKGWIDLQADPSGPPRSRSGRTQ